MMALTRLELFELATGSTCQRFTLPVFFNDACLRLVEQGGCLFRMCIGKRLIAKLAIRVIFQGNARTRRVQPA